MSDISETPPTGRSIDEIATALAAPFDQTEIKFKAQTVSGNRALAVAFVDARVVQDRLDEVLGVLNWQDSYEPLPDGSVICRLKIRIGVEWIAKEDVGGQSEQPDEGDRRKAAFSDALKRTAVKFGVGRYLYRTKPQWVDWDVQKRQFVRQPTLPQIVTQMTKPIPPPVQSPRPTNGKPAEPPSSYAERIKTSEAKAVGSGWCKEGELVAHVKDKLGKDYPGEIDTWPGEAWQRICDVCKVFAGARQPITPDLIEQVTAELDRTGRKMPAVVKMLQGEMAEGRKPVTWAKIGELDCEQGQLALKRLKQLEAKPAEKK